MRDTQLLTRLNEAANGHIAINGDSGPNLFSDAISEINRLRTLEDMVRRLFDNNNRFHRGMTLSFNADQLKKNIKLAAEIAEFLSSKSKAGGV